MPGFAVFMVEKSRVGALKALHIAGKRIFGDLLDQQVDMVSHQAIRRTR